MRGTFRRFTRPLVADTFGQRNRHGLGFIAGSRTRPCSGFLASRPYKHAKQKKYHVRNWAEYNEGLRRRGDLTVWFDEEAIANWKADKTGEPGGQRVYSDMAIETGLVVRMVYKLAYRQTEGFLHSIASLLGLGIEIPDYSTLCRRSRLLRKKLRIPKAASTQPIHLMIDSTGLRIHVGNARKPPKQRAWRKLHIAVDRETGNIVASELTASRARDATRVPALLTQIQAPLVSVAADSAYDKEAVYEAIEAHSPGRRTRVVIPPQRNATLSQNSNTARRCCTALAESKCAYGGGRGMFDHEVSQAQPVQAREAEEVPRSQLGGIQRRAAPPRRFDGLV